MKTLTLILAIISSSMLIFATNPVVTNVQILGEALYNGSATTVGTYGNGTILTGFYTFSDADGHTDASTYNWYIDTNNDGNWSDEVSVGTGIRFTVTNPATTPRIFFVVSPKDSNAETATDEPSTGVVPSTTTYNNSGTTDKILNATTVNDLSTVLSNNKKISLFNGASLTIHGDLDSNNGDSIIVRDGTTLTVKGQFITNNNIIVVVEDGGTFNVESGFQANNNAVLTISGTVNVTGNLSVNNNTSFTVNGTGTVAVTGDLNFGPGNSNSLIVDGNMTVGGNVTGKATLSGGGLLSVSGSIGANITDTTGGTLLPIELVYFKAETFSSSVSLLWETASEKNNDFFTIERATDGINYSKIGTVKGAGNSYSNIKYVFTDNNPINGVAYYRLKQTDYDGTTEIFSPISVSCIIEKNILVGPTFATDVINIVINNEAHNIDVYLYNMNGTRVKTIKIDNNFTTVDITDLAIGTYMLVFAANDSKISKLIIVK